MADFLYTMTFYDAFAGVATRSYHITALDFIAARVVADAQLAAGAALSTAGIQKDSLAEITSIAGVVGASSNIDEGITFQYNIGGGKRASISFPAPLTTVVNSDRSVDLSNPLVTAWNAQYLAGNILVSDGEGVVSVVKGQLDK